MCVALHPLCEYRTGMIHLGTAAMTDRVFQHWLEKPGAPWMNYICFQCIFVGFFQPFPHSHFASSICIARFFSRHVAVQTQAHRLKFCRFCSLILTPCHSGFNLGSDARAQPFGRSVAHISVPDPRAQNFPELCGPHPPQNSFDRD